MQLLVVSVQYKIKNTINQIEQFPFGLYSLYNILKFVVCTMTILSLAAFYHGLPWYILAVFNDIVGEDVTFKIWLTASVFPPDKVIRLSIN